MTVCDSFDLVVRQVKCQQLVTVFETLYSSDQIVGKIQDVKLGEVVKILDPGDLVLMQIQAAHSFHMGQARYLFDAVAFHPDGFDISESFQVFDFLKAFVVQIKLGVSPRSCILSIELAYIHHILVSQYLVAILVDLHLRILQRSQIASSRIF